MISKIIKKIFPLLFVNIFIASFFLIKQKVDLLKNLIYPNVFIDQTLVAYKTKEEVITMLEEKNKRLVKAKIIVIFNDQKIATFSGEKLKVGLDSQTAALQAYLIGRSPLLLSSLYQKITTILNLKKYFVSSSLKYDKDLIRQFISQMEDTYNKPAKNALFTFENGRVTAFAREEKGFQLLSDKFLKDFDEAVKELKYNAGEKTIVFSYQIIEPEITLAKANNFGIEEFLAEGKSDFSHSIPERIHNIILAASKFNGVLIPKDKILSFNETVGEISSLTGYKPAFIIKNGKTVLGDGGGICQVSTTLFRAALNAGLEIVERHPHAYRVSYYENDSKPGFDATVFAPTVDLKIKNNTPAYILLESEVDKKNNLLRFYLFGKKDNREVKISSIQIWDIIPPPEPKYQDDPTLKKGIVRQIDFAAWGGKASFNYQVFKNGEKIIDEVFFSNYRPWQAVYLVGVGE